MDQVLPSVCPLDCPDTCSLSVTVRDNQVVAVSGSQANPYTDGVICNKVKRSYPELVHGKYRLTHPLKRIGPKSSNQFEQISWAHALDLVYDGFQAAIAKDGPQSILQFNYAGPHGALAGGSMDERFFNKLGATQPIRGPLCGGVKTTAYNSVFGTAPGMPPKQILHSDLIVVWGSNVTVANLHMAPLIKKARKKGAKLVIIDPKRTKIAEQADLFIQLHPGTDIVLALGLAAQFEQRGLLDTAFIDEWCVGFDDYMAEARKHDLDTVLRECRLEKAEFEALLDLYAHSKNVAAVFGNGLERSRSGGNGIRAAMSLQALSGHHGRLGAGVVAKSSYAVPKTGDILTQAHLRDPNVREINIIDLGKTLLDRDMDTPIRAAMIYNHNPVATHPDQGTMIKALSQDDLFLVGCDISMTDTMALCDVILPAATHFEYDDLYACYGHNYVQRAQPVIPCVGESLPNTEIFRRLAARFGYNDDIFKADEATLMDQAMNGNDPRFKGIKPSEIPVDSAIGFYSPEDEDLILCKTVFPKTPSGKIELFSQDMEDRFGFGIPRYVPVQPDHPFTIMSPGSPKRTNATFGQCAQSDGVEIVEINPKDAAAYGLQDGEHVLVFNQRADVEFKVKVTDATRPGVLFTPKGAWRKASRTGFSVNALIPVDIKTDIDNGACYNETFVDIKKITA